MLDVTYATISTERKRKMNFYDQSNIEYSTITGRKQTITGRTTTKNYNSRTWFNF